MKKILVGSIAAACLIGTTGCTQPNMTDSQRTKAEGTGTGVIAGALIGGLIGGRDGAALGAALGGVAGYAYGSYVAEEKAKYANTEDWLNSEINKASQENKNIRAYNAKLSREIAETKRLVKLYNEKKISKEKLMAQKKLVEKHRKEAQQKLAAIEETLKNQKSVLAESKKSNNPVQTKRIAKEVKTMEKEKNTLKAHTRTYADMSVMLAV